MIVRNLIAALREDETIYVNDLGFFRRVFTRAHIEGNNAIPPRYSVTLNSEEDGSGYAFILYVSKSENIRIVDADLAIRRWVDQLLEELHKGRSVTVEGFGTFSWKKNKLEFTAAPEIPELNVEFEGLEQIAIQKYPKQKHPERTEMLPVIEPAPVTEPKFQTQPQPAVEPEPEPQAQPQPDIEPELQPDPEPVNEPESVTEPQTEPQPEPFVESELQPEPEPVNEPESVTEPQPEPQPQPFVEPELQPEPEPISDPDPVTEPQPEPQPQPDTKKHWGWIVFVVVLLLAIVVLGWFFKDSLLNFYHQKFDNQVVADTVTMVDETPLPVEEDTMAEADTIGIVEEEPVMEEPMPEVKPFDINHLEHINYEKGKFYLVHGSFSKEADCARHIRTHHFETYSPTVLHQSGNSRLRVCLGVFNSEEASMQFAETNGIKDAWTLK